MPRLSLPALFAGVFGGSCRASGADGRVSAERVVGGRIFFRRGALRCIGRDRRRSGRTCGGFCLSLPDVPRGTDFRCVRLDKKGLRETERRGRVFGTMEMLRRKGHAEVCPCGGAGSGNGIGPPAPSDDSDDLRGGRGDAGIRLRGMERRGNDARRDRSGGGEGVKRGLYPKTKRREPHGCLLLRDCHP